ncbi:branched-chain amino acid ABC transporter permease [Lentibacter algarum]|uniref:branched-chain amino acid ABC transporter permease n=1 Tax=Lentibacter algarum TaxID=576131 RepID=UPI001C06CFDA|nr:branched-chain amino acid ABC transporter permease [Lentibacter algarum]MBU2981849.1 branched-chain amino acid ABC transporter permease [Lentibacter algarum]
MTRILAIGAVLILASLPFWADRGVIFLGMEILVVVALAQAWNLPAGYGGLLSLGHHGFVGLGGYALYVLSRDLGMHVLVAIPLAGVVTAIFALFIAPILFRLREVYFAVGMWVAAEILRILVSRSDWLGGASGLPLSGARDLPRAWMGPSAYWMALTAAVGTTLLVWALMRSSFGLRLRALRDDEAAARAIGVKPHRVRLIVFVLSAGATGMAGATMFFSSLFISPLAAFDMGWIVTIVFVTLIGGLGRLSGPFLGAAFYFLLREGLADYGNWYLIALGAAAMAIMLVLPGGLASLSDRFTPSFTKTKEQP